MKIRISVSTPAERTEGVVEAEKCLGVKLGTARNGTTFQSTVNTKGNLEQVARVAEVVKKLSALKFIENKQSSKVGGTITLTKGPTQVSIDYGTPEEVTFIVVH